RQRAARHADPHRFAPGTILKLTIERWRRFILSGTAATKNLLIDSSRLCVLAVDAAYLFFTTKTRRRKESLGICANAHEPARDSRSGRRKRCAVCSPGHSARRRVRRLRSVQR